MLHPPIFLFFPFSPFLLVLSFVSCLVPSCPSPGSFRLSELMYDQEFGSYTSQRVTCEISCQRGKKTQWQWCQQSTNTCVWPLRNKGVLTYLLTYLLTCDVKRQPSTNCMYLPFAQHSRFGVNRKIYKLKYVLLVAKVADTTQNRMRQNRQNS